MSEEEFAVSDGEKILFQTAGFRAELVTGKASLSGGKTLLICSPEREYLRNRLQEAEDAIAAKDTFLSNMSHDIRTPMNAIVGLTLLAKMHLDETPRVSDALNKIEIASGHLLSLINDVLDMSRINSGKMQISGEEFHLNDLIHDTLVIVRPHAEKKKHTLRLVTEDITEETLVGDVMRLRQIFVNIIGNAVKYTDDGGEITVRFSETTEHGKCVLVFACRDNGIGMTPEFLERIFLPFERVNSSTVSRIEGTGLGMSIVKKLVEAMEGTISIQSEPQKGTDVEIRIPLDYHRQTVKTEALRGKRVLVTEAEQELRDRYSGYLTEFGTEHTIVSTVQEAIDALADADISGKPYDAAIIGQDCGEGQDKLDFAAYLHKSSPALSLLLVSDDNWDSIRYQAEQSGIVGFIPLPLLRMSLANGLMNVLENLPEAKAASGYPNLSGKKLLLAEDNMINREIALEILSFTGADVDTAENGEEAVARFNASDENEYSLILMDIQMPVMNGYEATALIRAANRPDAKKIPIFAMTANTFAEDIAKAHAAGMNGHIAKPIDHTALIQALSTIEGR